MNKTETLEELNKYRYAHRGLHDKPEIPENSLIAFRRAADLGFGIELDIHLTRDGKLAVIHDSSLRRTTSRRSDHFPLISEYANKECKIITACESRIEELTIEEAKKFPLEESDERIPEFKEVLELVNGRAPIIIELKPVNGNHAELCRKVMSELKGYEGIYCLESFNSFAVLTLKKEFPEVIRGQLGSDLTKDHGSRVRNDPREDFRSDKLTNIMVRDLLMNQLTGPDFVAYNFKHRRNRAFRDFNGAKVFYTITDPLDLEIGEKMGATCIFERFIPKSPSKGGAI